MHYLAKRGEWDVRSFAIRHPECAEPASIRRHVGVTGATKQKTTGRSESPGRDRGQKPSADEAYRPRDPGSANDRARAAGRPQSGGRAGARLLRISTKQTSPMSGWTAVAPPGRAMSRGDRGRLGGRNHPCSIRSPARSAAAVKRQGGGDTSESCPSVQASAGSVQRPSRWREEPGTTHIREPPPPRCPRRDGSE